MKAYLELKASILYHTGGKSELDSMDKLLPLSIYISTQVQLSNPVAEVSMIDDYFKYCKECLDKESLLLTNFKASI